jgi:hypothetical protein
MATIEEVLTQASVRDFGHVGDRFTAATAEAADLETRWATLRGLAPDSRLPDAVIGLIGSIDSLVAAAEVRHATLGTWAIPEARAPRGGCSAPRRRGAGRDSHAVDAAVTRLHE